MPFVGEEIFDGTRWITFGAAPAPVAPGAPTGFTATPLSTQITASCNPPISDGGSAVISYTWTCNPGGFTSTTPAGVLTKTFTGLTPTTPYTVTVFDTNAVGNSPTLSLPVTTSSAGSPQTIPRDALGVQVSAGDSPTRGAAQTGIAASGLTMADLTPAPLAWKTSTWKRYDGTTGSGTIYVVPAGTWSRLSFDAPIGIGNSNTKLNECAVIVPASYSPVGAQPVLGTVNQVNVGPYTGVTLWRCRLDGGGREGTAGVFPSGGALGATCSMPLLAEECDISGTADAFKASGALGIIKGATNCYIHDLTVCWTNTSSTSNTHNDGFQVSGNADTWYWRGNNVGYKLPASFAQSGGYGNGMSQFGDSTSVSVKNFFVDGNYADLFIFNYRTDWIKIGSLVNVNFTNNWSGLNFYYGARLLRPPLDNSTCVWSNNRYYIDGSGTTTALDNTHSGNPPTLTPVLRTDGEVIP